MPQIVRCLAVTCEVHLGGLSGDKPRHEEQIMVTDQNNSGHKKALLRWSSRGRCGAGGSRTRVQIGNHRIFYMLSCQLDLDGKLAGNRRLTTKAIFKFRPQPIANIGLVLHIRHPKNRSGRTKTGGMWPGNLAGDSTD